MAALFRIAKLRREANCLWTNECLRMYTCVCDGILLSFKKEGNPAVCDTWMYLEDISEVK